MVNYSSGKTWSAAILAIAALAVAAAFALGRYRAMHPPLSPPPAITVTQAPPASGSQAQQKPMLFQPPSPQERDRMRNEFVSALQLTHEQLNALKTISARQNPDEGPGALHAVMREFEPHLTPEQRVKARQFLDRHVRMHLEQAARTLPPAEYAKLREKVGQRIKEQAQGK